MSETVRLWDVAKKKAVDVPLEGAKAGLQAGALQPLAGAPIPLRMPSGAIRTFDPKELGRGFEEGGVFAPSAEARDAAQREKYAGQGALAAGAGALKGMGAALGVPTDRVFAEAAPYVAGFRQEQDLYRGHFVSGVGERIAEANEQLAARNGLAHGAGELGGYVAGSAFTGGGLMAAGSRAGIAGATLGASLEGAMMAEVELDNELARHGEALTGESLVSNGGVQRILAGGVLGAGAGFAGHAAAMVPGMVRRGAAGLVGGGVERGAALAGRAAPYVERGLGAAAGAAERGLGAAEAEILKVEQSLSARGSAPLSPEVAAAEHADPLARRLRFAPGEDILTAAGANDPRGHLMMQGKEALDRIQKGILDEAHVGLSGVVDHSPSVMKETHGARWAEHRAALAPPGLTPETEAAARQVIADTAEPAREMVAARAEAEMAYAEARQKHAGLLQAEKENAKYLSNLERDVKKTSESYAKRVEAAEARLKQKEALLEVERAQGTEARQKAAALEVERERVKFAGEQANAERATGKARELLEQGRSNVTGYSEEARAVAMGEIASAERRMLDTENPMLEQYQHFLNKVDDIGAKPPQTNAEWHAKLQEIKDYHKRLGQYAVDAGSSRGTDVHLTGADGPLAQAAKRHKNAAEAIRQQQQSEFLYGELGAWERDFKRVRSAQIESEALAFKGFTTEVEIGGVKRDVADSSKLRSQLGREALHASADGVEGLKRQEMKRWLSNTRRLHELAEERLPLSAEQMAKSQQVRADIDRMERALDESATHAEVRDRMSKAGAYAGASGLRSSDTAVVGSIIGGAPGGFAGGVAGALSSNGQRLAHKAAAVRMVAEADRVMGTSFSNFFKGKPVPELHSAVRGLRVTVGDARSASARFLSGAGGPRATFERSVGAVKSALADPKALGEKVTRALAGTDAVLPGVAMMVSQTLMRGLAHLVEHIPAGMTEVAPVVAPHHIKPIYSDAEMRSWARRAAAVNEPLSTLESMRRGTLSPEEVEVLQQVYPELYGRMREAMAKSLAALPEQPGRAQRIQMGVAFGVPVDLNMTADILVYLQTPPDGRGGGRREGAKNGGGLKAPVLKNNHLSNSLKLETQKDRQ